MKIIPRFRLEQAYRERFAPGMFDLSSSSPQALTLRDVLDDAGIASATLLNSAMDYEPGGGRPALREAIASLFHAVSADQVLVTAGAGEAIRVVTEVAVSAGDTAVVQLPAYEALRIAPTLVGARLLDWAPSPDGAFDFGSLPHGAGAATAVFLNNPHGPGGSLLRGVYDGPARVVADEVYRPAALVASHGVRSMIDSMSAAVSIGDISKPLGLGGLRVGWIVSRDREFIRACATALDYHSCSVSAPSAHVALAALSHFDLHLARQLDRARTNLQLLAAFMEEHEPWIEWSPPQAGYTAFPRLRSGSTGALAARLATRGIFLLDGSPFDAPDHLRIGVGLEREAFLQALGGLGEELRSFGSGDPADPSDGDVIVLAKEPVPGRAKTRLAADVGQTRAARLCDAFVRDTLDFAARRSRRLYVAASPAASLPYFRALTSGVCCFAQPEGDLGARLMSAFETALGDGAERPVLIGSDSPTLPSHLLSVAHRALRSHDVVLGPAEDGGYYLIGMNVPHGELFGDIDWGTDRVLAQTLDRAHAAGLDVFLLPHWYDVDDGRDLERLAGDPLLRAHTRRALRASPVAEMVG
jgi:rSAM/selenodomain-associated transferase 1